MTGIDVDPAAWHAGDEEQPAAHAAGSILGQIAQRRAELAQGRKPLDLEIPGYDGQLWCRYRFVSYDRLANIGVRLTRTVKDEATRNLLGCVDTLIACCDEILVRNQAGALVSMSSEIGDDRPVQYDRRLADGLGFEAETARDVVLGVFANEYALIGQAGEVTEWLTRESPEVDKELLGES